MNGNSPRGSTEDMQSNVKAARSPRKTAPGGTTAKSAALDDSDVGSALRSAYQQTISEDIPAEMLDLLNKLT